MLRLVITAIALGLLSSCATNPPFPEAQVTVTTFHRLPADLNGKTFAITPTDEQRDSLQYRTYREQVAARFLGRGMREAPPAQADYLVAFDYFIDNGSVRTVSIPIWGQTGTGGAVTTGTATSYGGVATFNQTTTYTPSYGVTGYMPRSVTVFTRRLNVVIISREALPGDTSRRVYEANAVSTGRTGQLAVIAPIMISAVFKDFPGLNGSTRTSSVMCGECAP